MEHADIAQVAAAGGALGSVLVLLARGRWPLLGGLAVLALAETGLALGLAGTEPLSRIDSPATVGAGALGLVALGAAAWLLARRPALVPLAVLVAAPLRPPLDFDPSARLLVS